jgi:hypothetical protein
MLNRIAALIMILIISSQALASGIVCGINALSKALSEENEMACPMQGEGDCKDMACCLQGKSPAGSIVAMICCEVVCGESTGGAQFDFTPQTLAQAPPIVSYRSVDFDSLSSDTDSSFSVFLRSAENDLLFHDPPDLFLINSTFLI